MIKRLRRRFIIVNMSILTCVLIAVLTAVFVLMYDSEVHMSYKFMESVLYQNEKPEPIAPPEDNDVISLDFSSEMSSSFFTLANNFYDPDRSPNPNPYFGDDRNNDRNKDNEWDREFMPPFDDDMRPPFGDDDRKPDKPVPEPSEPDKENTAPTKPADNSEKNTDPTERPSFPKSKETEKKTDSKGGLGNSDTTQAGGSTESDDSPYKAETKATSSATTEKISGTTTAATTAVSGSMPIKRPPEKKERSDPYMGNVKRTHIFVRFKSPDKITDISYRYCENEDDEAVAAAVKTIAESKKERGKISINNQKYRYLMTSSTPFNGFELVLLDRTLEISTINRLLFIFIIIVILGIIIILGISIILANWTIRPVDRAWNQQKQFVADASHELKTPLTVISANTDVILSSPDDLVKNQTKWLNYIKSETIRMSKLVNNMLCIAKYDTNNADVEINRFNLSSLITSVCIQFENIVFENEKHLETNIKENISVNGDEDKIKQLLTILLDNAVKYSLPNGTIRVQLCQEKQNKAVITVSNSCEPISDEQIKKIFDRFYRIDDSRNRKTGGSGLGLNIAKTIAEAHKGTIFAKYSDGVISFNVVI